MKAEQSPGQKFAAMMRAAGLRQADMARLTGKDRRTVWRWCRGHSEVPVYAWTILEMHTKR